jgi:transglutaminase-like putative cysteine protease
VTANTRITLTAAVATAATSVGLYPLFIGTTWFYAGLGAVITAAACGALSRRRRLPVLANLAIGVIGLLLYLNVVFEARRSWAVIPTADSVRRLWHLLATGLQETRTYAPPAAQKPELLLLAVGGIGLAALATDLIAVRLRSAALAGLPLLVLFTVPIAMNGQHEGLGTAVVFCLGAAGYLAMLSADGRDRIRVWGRLVTLWRSGSVSGVATGPAPSGGPARANRGGDREKGPDTRSLAAAGRRVGLASVVLALAVPLIVPGLHASKLFSSGPGIGGRGSGPAAPAVALADTLSQTLRQLQESHPTDILRYTTTVPARLMASDPPYLQAVVYDTLADSGQWTSSYTAGAQPSDALPPPAGLSSLGAFPQYQIAVTVADHALDSRPATFLALPYPATQVSTPPGDWLVNPNLMVFLPSPSISVQHYQASFAEVEPTAAELNAAAAPPSLPADIALPKSFQAPALKQIAESVTAGYRTEFGKVNALASWLGGPTFTYKADAPTVNSAASLLTFLTRTRAGVCVQSAFAMTVLTRLLGIPARLASGFTEGTKSGNSYQVTTDDAHAWAEVYFSGYGWIKFEATPGGGDGSARAPSYQTPTAGSGSNVPPGFDTVGPTAGSVRPAPAAGSGIRKLIPNDSGLGAAPATGQAGPPWAAIVLAVTAAIALACGLIAMLAPPSARLAQAQPADAARRRRPPWLSMALGVTAVVAVLALALYRLLSRTPEVNFGAGWATVGLAFAAAAGAVLVIPGVSRVVRRRWRWLRARGDAGRAHAAWREFRGDLADLGVRCPPSEPPRTLAGRVGAGLPDQAREAAIRLALAEERACYAAQPSPSGDLRRDAAAARRGLAASAGRGRRWQARIFPASVIAGLADWAAGLPDRVAGLIRQRWAERRSAS